MPHLIIAYALLVLAGAGVGLIVARRATKQDRQLGDWTVPRIAHDPSASVGPKIKNGWVRREAGWSEPWHARQYAARLLAAADAAEHQTTATGKETNRG
ncbi:hypothetical protein amrb99_98380 [Actinomadura sp. RB99]|uniref:hypothetical protein n=1 Tax=Actinomadura sp. RB99 TaxID=2691577 RepID=UPI001689E818|nr:hypothetical protein [Actinomadura sp. RB99]MBD2900828.1 hypothetical protein [Actinomadura sp. RB99]